MQHDSAHAVLGGLVVTGLFLGLIATMEPAAQRMRLPFGAPAAPARYTLMDAGGVIVGSLRRTVPSRRPAPSLELQ
jgi:hypothetical protein